MGLEGLEDTDLVLVGITRSISNCMFITGSGHTQYDFLTMAQDTEDPLPREPNMA